MIQRVLRWGTAVGCGYECAALVTRRVPTISILVGRYRIAGPVIGGVCIGGLAAHFMLDDQ